MDEGLYKAVVLVAGEDRQRTGGATRSSDSQVARHNGGTC